MPVRALSGAVRPLLPGRQSKPEAAKELNWKEGTVSSRLARARRLLQQRLTRRGIALRGTDALAVTESASLAAVPTALADSTSKAARALVGGQQVVDGLVSTKVAALVEGMIRAAFVGKLKASAVTAVAAVLLVLGTMACAYAVLKKEEPAPPSTAEERSPVRVEQQPTEPPKPPAVPEKVAEEYFVPLDGSGKDVKPADFGYQVDVAVVGTRVTVRIGLQEKTAERFQSGRLVLTRGDRPVVETDVALEQPKPPDKVLTFSFDTRFIDDGELIIRSAKIEGQPPIAKFSGFRLTMKYLLESAKKRTPKE